MAAGRSLLGGVWRRPQATANAGKLIREIRSDRDCPARLGILKIACKAADAGREMSEVAVVSPSPAGARERLRRAEALRAHRADARVQSMASAGEVAYLRAQMTLAARLTARLAATNDVAEMAELVVGELHGTFAFYLAAVQRLDGDGVLRLVAGSGPLAEVMAEFLLVEQSVDHGVNGRVARTGESSLVGDTRADRDYIVRDPKTDPRSELSVPV